MVIRRKPVPKCTASDIDPIDRQWVDMIVAMQGLTVGEVEKRIRRIRHDPKLQAKFLETQAQLRNDAVITNVEWSGPEMKDITISVAPAPAILEDGKAPTTDPARSIDIMRQRVMMVELGKIFRRSGQTVLPGLVSAGYVPLRRRCIEVESEKFAFVLQVETP